MIITTLVEMKTYFDFLRQQAAISFCGPVDTFPVNFNSLGCKLGDTMLHHETDVTECQSLWINFLAFLANVDISSI